MTRLRTHLDADVDTNRADQVASLLDVLINEVHEYHDKKHDSLQEAVRDVREKASVEFEQRLSRVQQEFATNADSKLDELRHSLDSLTEDVAEAASGKNDIAELRSWTETITQDLQCQIGALTQTVLEGQMKAETTEKDMNSFREERWKMERENAALRKDLESLLSSELQATSGRFADLEADFKCNLRRYESCIVMRLDSLKADGEVVRRELDSLFASLKESARTRPESANLSAELVDLRRVVHDLADASRSQGETLQELSKGMEAHRDATRSMRMTPLALDYEPRPMRRTNSGTSFADTMRRELVNTGLAVAELKTNVPAINDLEPTSLHPSSDFSRIFESSRMRACHTFAFPGSGLLEHMPDLTESRA